MWVGLIGFRLCKGNDLQRREQAVLLDRRSGIFSGKDNFIGMLSRQDGKHRPAGSSAGWAIRRPVFSRPPAISSEKSPYRLIFCSSEPVFLIFTVQKKST